MTPEQINLVKETWQRVLPISQTAGEIFYDRLADFDPSISDQFDSDHVDQVKSLMTSLDVVFTNLDDINTVLPVMDSFGHEDVGYGVMKKDYDHATDALFWTLEHGLGEEFTDDVREAWMEALSLMGSMMATGSRRIN